MGQDFDNFRGRGGRGRGRGDGGNSRGFRGGGGGGRGSGGFRGGFRGGSDRGSGGFRGGFRGQDRGNDRGGDGNFRGGDRGFRGGGRGFRGGDRGGFRGADRGSFRGGDRGNMRGGRGSFRGGRGGKQMDKNVVQAHQYQEIRDGLCLFVIYKKAPTLEETKEHLPGFHSRTSRPVGKDASSLAHILLFTDVESLENAKTKLSSDENVESVDYMGMRSAKKQPDVKETRQLYLRFDSPKEEGDVKELDEKIIAASMVKNNQKLWLAEFSTTDEARKAVEGLKAKTGKETGLEDVRESFGMNYQIEAQQGINRGMVVFRDVLKTATLKDAATLFPNAISFQLFKNTFHDSKYCHAAVGFTHMNEANKFLDGGPIMFLGKKIFPFPAHVSLVQDMLKLGKQKSEEIEAAAKIVKEAATGPPSKKIKMEKESEDSGDEEMEEDDDEENGEEEAEGEDEEGDEDDEDDDDDDEEDETD